MKRVLEVVAFITILISAMGMCGFIEFGQGLWQVIVLAAIGGISAWVSRFYTSL